MANPVALAALLTDPAQVGALPKADIPELLGALEVIRARLLLRLQTNDTAPPSSGREALLTALEASERLGMPLQRVYELCRTGRLPHVRVGRQVRIAPAALDTWIANGGKA